MEKRYSSKDFSHLGLVAGMCDKLGIVEIMGKLLPMKSSQQLVSNGICVKSFILMSLGFVERRLYLMSNFYRDKPIEHLLGSGISHELLNDDRLGRCLYAIYEYGTSALFEQLSSHACSQLGLACEACFHHIDSTSFHTDGQYADCCDENGSEKGCILVTEGYSRDHRPDLKQVMLNLVVEHKASIPVL